MDFMLGQLLLMPITFVPAGALACNGQTLSIQQYTPLYQMIGTTFGGDGRTTFALPAVPPVPTVLDNKPGVPVNWCIVTDGSGSEHGYWGLLGQVMPMVVAPPSGSLLALQWLPCDGRLIAIDSNMELFALLGTQFGGDGKSTFALPKLAPITNPPTAPSGGPPIPYYICVDGTFPDSNGCNATAPSPGGDADGYLSQIYQVAYVPGTVDHLCGFGTCAGQVLDLASNGDWDILLSLIGAQFGGDGRQTFALPNIPTGADGISYVISTGGWYPPQD